MLERNFFCVLSDDLRATRDWYTSLLGYVADFESDWFIHLHGPENDQIELGIMARDSELIPQAHRARPVGGMLTVVVDDVDDLYRRAIGGGFTVVEPPRDLFYGQRRMLAKDPNGMLVDISSPCDPDPDWLASLQG